MSRGSHRFTLEDASKLPLKNQQEIAAQIYGNSAAAIADKALRGGTVDETLAAGLEVVEQGRKAEIDRIIIEAACSGGPILSEHSSQVLLLKWWGTEAVKLGIDERLLMAFPLAGVRTKAAGGRLKAEGMRAGTPDLLLAVARGDRAGLWIEMKTLAKTSRIGDNQKAMLKLLSSDYATVVCRTTREAQAVIVAYLSL